jgi:multiple sugar transport system substrate-binding protein
MRISFLYLLLTAVIITSGCAPDRRESDGQVTISVWHPWGGIQKELFEEVVREFERHNPDIRVRIVFTPNDLSNNQKFFTSVAAKKPPDVCFVDGPQVAEWAEQGALSPLDDYLKRDRITEDDYFPPCWAQNHYKGNVWALTFCADPNFAFVWNKTVFREAGLDPERPPQTIEELDWMAERLTKFEGGRMTQIGIIPWAQYGNANSMFTWGWVFGGEFFEPETGRITADDPRCVKALEWMYSYAQKYGINRVASLQQGFGSAEQNPFYIGKLAMTCLHISGIEDIKTYAPNLDYGVTYIPAPPDGEQHSSWVGGWCISIPKGSRHPEEAWRFIRWMCADPEGTSIVASTQRLFPGYRHSPYFDTIREIPGYSQFLEILEECRHQRPVMPAQAYYMGAVSRAVDQALYGRKTPQQALEDAARETQAELDSRVAER